ncbi:unnamed protein product [Mytilus edulis]|uniref:Uncharacterized protein n=1 Tax=Mytilus edulis TaxID=6550 RepID=A0A8S3SRG4_MYTED|nr:unnamed protein product [Mytilus edulis]
MIYVTNKWDIIFVIRSLEFVKVTSFPCPVTYQHPKHMQAQTGEVYQIVPTQFEFGKKVPIPLGRITCMTLTDDNILLLCNDMTSENNISAWTETGQYLQSYTCTKGRVFGITIISGTDEAVATLPDNELLQFINLTTFTGGKQIEVPGVRPYGVAVVKDKVLVGCGDGKISFIELNTEECHQTLNVGSGIISSLIPVVDDKDELLYYCEHTGGNLVSCIKFDGTRISHVF